MAFAMVFFLVFRGLTSPAQSDETGALNREVRGILSDKCFKCHGPDATSRKGDLRLDDRHAALKAGAFVPGKPEESELIRRIDSGDDAEKMPPPGSGKTLNAGEKELLRKWVASGGIIDSHWSFQPIPKSPPIPPISAGATWIKNPIDAFVLAKLNAAQVEPAPETTREKWLRRATFDLTGLPPTLEEIDAFLADQSPQAYETVVDRLLKSPSYGERMAVDWLDSARYADTFGYQSDRDMHVWPWRDWVIRAFNDNLPFDQFIVWQTAGDLLENPTRDQYLATAFNRLHRQTNEGGSIEAEFRVAYVSDRVNTNVTTFLGLTSECSRCHDHKYDPFSQRDFYRLAAFYGNIDEHGLYSHFTETAPTPALLLYEGEQEQQHKSLLEQIRNQETVVAKVREEARERLATNAGEPPAVIAPAAKYTFEDANAAGDYTIVAGKVGKGIQFGGDDAFVCKDAGAFNRSVPFSFAFWMMPGPYAPRQIVIHRSVAAEDAAFRGYSLVLDQGHAVFSLIHFWPGNAIQIRSVEPLKVGEWSHVAITYDGSSRAAGLKLRPPSSDLASRGHLLPQVGEGARRADEGADCGRKELLTTVIF